MGTAAIITLIVILGAIVLFATELLTIDLVALIIMGSLIVFGVITPEEGIAGFSNNATITVAFMFVLSAAILKTGALQYITSTLARSFKNNFMWGMLLMMLFIALISAFINNTPVVAVFIPVVIQIANASGVSPLKMLIPLSFASILGGMCTLVGTSTNILVSGIIEKEGLAPFSMFQLAPIGILLLVVGIVYLLFIGIRLLPSRKESQDLTQKFNVDDYITEIQLLENASSVGTRIMDSEFVKELEMDIIEVRRKGARFSLPSGDFVLQENDVLKIRCNVDKIKLLKEREKIAMEASIKIAGDDLSTRFTALVEMVVTSDSNFDGSTLKELDFRRRYRAIPLAIKHREEIKHDRLYQTTIKSGDVILAEVKNHYVPTLKKMANEHDAPFILISENALQDFNKKRFAFVLAVIAAVMTTAALGILPIMVATLLGVIALVTSRTLSMKEVYEAINWKIVFLLAGALSLGVAMKNSGLDQDIAQLLVSNLQRWGPVAILSGLYLTTSILTELMSNNATAALMAPIALAIAHQMGIDPMPFIIAITIGASASFMTPVGYQTNAMVYSAGQYKFLDFIKVGTLMNILFWILATIFIPMLYSF